MNIEYGVIGAGNIGEAIVAAILRAGIENASKRLGFLETIEFTNGLLDWMDWIQQIEFCRHY